MKGKERPQIKPTFTSVFSLNTDAFEKLYKELEIVLYHGLKKNLEVVKKTLGVLFFNTLLGVLM